MKMKEWFIDETKWTQNAAYRDKSGNELNELGVCEIIDICSCCLLGAVELCYKTKEHDYYEEIARKIEHYLKYNTDYNDIIKYNDSPNTTFNDIKQLVEELDI